MGKKFESFKNSKIIDINLNQISPSIASGIIIKTDKGNILLNGTIVDYESGAIEVKIESKEDLVKQKTDIIEKKKQRLAELQEEIEKDLKNLEQLH